MKKILDFDKLKSKPLRAKNEKNAFITFLIILVLLFLKSTSYLLYLSTIDSPLFPTYSINYANQDSFISGAIITILLIISLISFYQKKFTFSFLLNCFIIVFNIGFSYFYYSI